MIKYSLLILLLLSNALQAEIITTSINETYSENVKVSGKFLKGIQFDSKSDRRSLHVVLPENLTGVLCVELASIDGKYKAKLEFELTSPQVGGLTPMNFKSKYNDVVSKYSNQELAISASVRSSCQDHNIAKRLISSWNKSPTTDLILLIRSDARKDTAYIPNSENFEHKVKCKKIRKPHIISFDKYCKFENIEPGKVKEIEIIRKNLQPIEAEIITIN